VGKTKEDLRSRYHASLAFQLLRKTNSIHQNSSVETYNETSMDKGQYFLYTKDLFF